MSHDHTTSRKGIRVFRKVFDAFRLSLFYARSTHTPPSHISQEEPMRFSVKYVLAVLSVMLLLPAVTFAQWTPAGTTITNTAYLDYKSASGSQSFTQLSAQASFVVQQRAAVNLALGAGTATTGEGQSYNIPLTVTNQGNGSDSFTLSSTQPAGWTVVFYIDANANSSYDAGEELTSTASLAAGGSVATINAWVSVPNDAPSSTGNNVAITATSNFDESSLGGSAVDANVFSTQTQVVEVKTADVTVTKSVSPANPSPGATVTYTLTYQNSGTAAATGISITDVLAAGLTFGSTQSAPATTTTNTTGLPTVVWNVPNLAAGDNTAYTITFTATVGAALTSGTVIGNTATIAYTDNQNATSENFTSTPSTDVTVTAELWTLVVTPTAGTPDNTGDQSVDVGSQAVYTLTLSNSGNSAADPTFTITQNAPSAGSALTWTYYRDANANGTYEAGTDVTTIASGASVGSIAASGSVVIFAVSNVDLTPTDGSTHLVDYAFASTNASTSGSSSTTIKKPIMSITKAVASTEADGTMQPGDVMEYTITVTNTGSGAASNVVVTDAIPTNTTYVANSTTLSSDGGAAVALNDGTVYAAGPPAQITVNLTVPGKTTTDITRVIKFRVTIN